MSLAEQGALPCSYSNTASINITGNTQKSPFWCKKYKNFLGRGHNSLSRPHSRGVAGPLAAQGGGQICRPFVLGFW